MNKPGVEAGKAQLSNAERLPRFFSCWCAIISAASQPAPRHPLRATVSRWRSYLAYAWIPLILPARGGQTIEAQSGEIGA
jgi:hypothetical protein